VQKYSPKFHRTIKLAPAIGDWTTVHQREELDAIEIHPIRTSNFDSLTREQLRFLHYLHYRLAEKLCVKFSTDMDIKVELHTVLATQMSYQEFLENAKDKVVQADVVFSAGHKINLLFDWDLADMMINRLVGGAGSVGQSDVFTSIETHILKAQIEALLPEIAAAWHMTLPPESAIDFAVGQYRRNSKISSREAYVQFGVYLVFGQQELRKFVIAYPNTLLRGLVQNWQENQPKKEKRVVFTDKTLQSLKVGVCVSLGSASLTMSELRQLRVGDVVVLDSRTDQPLPVQVGSNTNPWLGYPGITQTNKVAIQLQRSDELAVVPEKKKTVPEPKVAPRHPVEVPAFVGADESFRSGAAPVSSGPVSVPGAMLGAVATAAVVAAPALVETRPAQDTLGLFEEDIPETIVDDHEFEIEDDLDYEDDHDDAQDASDEAFDFSEDTDEESLHEEVHGDADDSEFSWDDLDDEL
jgi:flagellar motor switch protein FliM